METVNKREEGHINGRRENNKRNMHMTKLKRQSTVQGRDA